MAKSVNVDNKTAKGLYLGLDGGASPNLLSSNPEDLGTVTNKTVNSVWIADKPGQPAAKIWAKKDTSPLGPAYTNENGKRYSNDWDKRKFFWSGYEWAVRGPSGSPQAPDPETGIRTWVDGVTIEKGDLTIETKGIKGGVEIISVPSLGYGTFEFTYSGNFGAWHPSSVFGIFTYDWAEINPGRGYSEIDAIEISRWNADNFPNTHGQVTYYPDEVEMAAPGYGISNNAFDIPNGYRTLSTSFEWYKDHLYVWTMDLTEGRVLLSDWYSANRIPRDNTQQMHINFWISEQPDPSGYQGWSTAHGDKVTFHSFTHKPV